MNRGVRVTKSIQLEAVLEARKQFEKYDSEMMVYTKFLSTERIPDFAKKDLYEFIRKIQEAHLKVKETIKKYNIYVDKYLEHDEAGQA